MFLKVVLLKEKWQGKQYLETTEWKIKHANDSKSVFRAKVQRMRRRYSALSATPGIQQKQTAKSDGLRLHFSTPHAFEKTNNNVLCSMTKRKIQGIFFLILDSGMGSKKRQKV